MKILICGSRTFANFALLKRKLDKLTNKLSKKFEVVTGACLEGADALGEKWAWQNWQRIVCVKRFVAEWKDKGKQAGPIRNSEMIAYLKESKDKSVVVAFWDGKSKGTNDLIEKAKKAKIKCIVVKF